MKQISKIIDDILVEWSYRVDSGMPNIKNPLHLVELEKSLNELNLPRKVSEKLLQNLREKEDEYSGIKGNPPKGKRTNNPNPPPKYKYDYSGGGTGKGSQDEPMVDKDAKKKEREEIRAKIAAREEAKINKDVNAQLEVESRISSVKVQAEFELDAKKEEKKLENIQKYKDIIIEELTSGEITKDFAERQSLLLGLAWSYGGRVNSGFGLNANTKQEVDLCDTNRKNLLTLYDKAKPELVERGVRNIRKNKVSEDLVKAGYDALPESVRKALAGKGKVGKEHKNIHFLGYIKNDGSITSDVNDPDIKIDEDGKKSIKRGGLPNADRGRMVYRMWLEQGGVDGYTGLPLQLERMDLEHVVGFNNEDAGTPSLDDRKNREHEANQILVGSALNQNKSDNSMEYFLENHIDKEKQKSEEEFDTLSGMYGDANTLRPVTQQMAFMALDEIQYTYKEGTVIKTITKSDYEALPEDEKPKIKKTELGNPKPRSANLSKNHTAETIYTLMEEDHNNYEEKKNIFLENDSVSKEDKASIKGMNTKIGKRIIQGLGIGGNIVSPSGRQSNDIFSKDEAYRGFIVAMANVPYEDRELFKKTWNAAKRHVESPEVRGKMIDDNGNEVENPNFHLKYPDDHKDSKKRGKNRARLNQSNEFKHFVLNATYPEGHKKAGQKLIPDELVKKYPKYFKTWAYNKDEIKK